MVHILLLIMSLAVLAAVAVLVLTALVWKRGGAEFLRGAFWLQLALLAYLVAESATVYASAFLFSLDPLQSGSFPQGIYANPLLLITGGITEAANSSLPYLSYSLFIQLLPPEPKGRLRSFVHALSIAIFALAMLAYAAPPLAFALGLYPSGAVRLLETVSSIIVVPGMLLVVCFALGLWLRNRAKAATALLKDFGDRFALTIAIVVLANIAVLLAAWLLPRVGGEWDDAAETLVSSLLCTFLPLVFAYAVLIRYSLRFFAMNPARSPSLGEGAAITDAFSAYFNLTARERQVCELIARGLPNKAICERLGITHGTAKNHVYNIFGKLKIQSRFELLTRLREFPPYD